MYNIRSIGRTFRVPVGAEHSGLRAGRGRDGQGRPCLLHQTTIMSRPPSVQDIKDLETIPTEVVIQTFSDRVLVLVTQLGKVGSLVRYLVGESDHLNNETQIQAVMPATAPLLRPPQPPARQDAYDLPTPNPSIQLTPLFGTPPPSASSPERMLTLQNLYAAQIATLVWAAEAESEAKAVVIGVALKPSRDGAELTGEAGVTETERRTFGGVMQMVVDLMARRE